MIGDDPALLCALLLYLSSSCAMTTAYSFAISSMFLLLSSSTTLSSTFVATVEKLASDCLALLCPLAHDLMLDILPGLFGLNGPIGLLGPASISRRVMVPVGLNICILSVRSELCCLLLNLLPTITTATAVRSAQSRYAKTMPTTSYLSLVRFRRACAAAGGPS